MNINFYEIFIATNIGEVNDIKYNKIKELIGENHNIILTEDSNELVISCKESEFNISISKECIRYVSNVQNIDKNFVNQIIKSLYTVFMIEDKNFGAVRVIATSNKDFNCFEDSKQSYKDTDKINKIKGLKGIGYRFISETSEYSEDFRKEPTLNCDNQYYYNIYRIFNKNKVELNTMLNNLEGICLNKDNEFIER